MNVQLIIYGVIAIVVLGLVYVIIRQFTKEGDETDIYLRKGNNNCSDTCGSVYFNELRRCSDDKNCLKEATSKFNSCVSKC